MRNRTVPLREQIKTLSKQLVGLQQQYEDLTATQSGLLLHYQVLNGFAEGLQVFNEASMLQGQQGTQQLQQLVEEECSLLRQLSSEHSLSSSTSSHMQEVMDLGVSTISPAGNPMAMFRNLMQLPPLAQAADTPAQQLAQEIKQWFGQLSIQLNKLQSRKSAAEATDALKEVQDIFLHTLVSFVMFGKQSALASVQSYNLETMQSDPANLQAATEHTLQVAADLGLTAQQGHNIATGVELYLRLQEGIQQEQHRLQAALEAAASSNSGAELGSSTAGLNSHAEQLELQQELYQRLQSLLQKQYVLQFVMIGWVVGCLSYEQLARASVLVWPYVIRYSHLGLGIQQWYRNNSQGKQGCSVKSSS